MLSYRAFALLTSITGNVIWGSVGVRVEPKGAKLLLILASGCRWDYPDEDNSYFGFKEMEESGVRAPFLAPVFPSYAYPNSHSLMTGLFPESHGFLSNRMYDPYYDDYFVEAPSPESEVEHWWNEAEPLWITAEKQGLRSALFWWDGCNVAIRGWKPWYCRPYREPDNWASMDSDFERALKSSLDLFETDEIQLAQMHYNILAYAGRAYGPDSDKRRYYTKVFDFILQRLQKEISKRGLQDKVNVVVVSDHGITTVPEKFEYINLSDVVNESLIFRMINDGAMTMLDPVEGELDKLYAELKNVKGLKVYRKNHIPTRYHLKRSRLMTSLMVVADNGFLVRLNGSTQAVHSSVGQNGFDEMFMPDMRGIFFARGSSFKKGFRTEALSMVDIYNVLCDVLGIVPMRNNGTRLRTDPMMNKAEVQCRRLDGTLTNRDCCIGNTLICPF